MKRLAAFTFLLLAAITRGEDFDTWFASSPDKQFIAVERRIADSELPSRLDIDGCTVFICAAEGGIQKSVVAQHTFSERVISGIQWSPDSKFLLFTTASSGGHSPWHFKTYVYSVADKSFRDVESATSATIGAGGFRFEPPDVAVLTVNVVPAESVKKIKLALGKSTQHMERLP